jgi:hypothetical protein
MCGSAGIYESPSRQVSCCGRIVTALTSHGERGRESPPLASPTRDQEPITEEQGQHEAEGGADVLPHQLLYNFYRSVPKAEKMGPRGAARMDSPTLVKDGNKFAGGVQQDFARSQSKDSKATAQPAKRAAELKSTFRGGVTVYTREPSPPRHHL